MEWLVLLHVVTAVAGIGPAFAFPFVLRHTSSAQEMERALGIVARLEMFPKMFGTLAVVSGIALFLLGSYGGWLQIWIAGTLLVYVVIEVIVVGMLNPTAKKLQAEVAGAEESAGGTAAPHAAQMYARVRRLHWWATALSAIILILMVLKPQ